MDVGDVVERRLGPECCPIPVERILDQPVDREPPALGLDLAAGRRDRAPASLGPGADPAAGARPRGRARHRSGAAPRGPSAPCSRPALVALGELVVGLLGHGCLPCNMLARSDRLISPPSSAEHVKSARARAFRLRMRGLASSRLSMPAHAHHHALKRYRRRHRYRAARGPVGVLCVRRSLFEGRLLRLRLRPRRRGGRCDLRLSSPASASPSYAIGCSTYEDWFGARRRRVSARLRRQGVVLISRAASRSRWPARRCSAPLSRPSRSPSPIRSPSWPLPRSSPRSAPGR